MTSLSLSAGVSIWDAQHHRRLASHLREVWHAQLPEWRLSQESVYIIDRVPPIAFVPTLLLAHTLCRANELRQIPLSYITHGTPATLHSSKSTNTRTLPPIPTLYPWSVQGIDPSTRLCIISYDSLKRVLNGIIPALHLPYYHTVLHSTHIFRHIEATALHRRGMSVSEIGSRMGHNSLASTKSYIHIMD